ncbi:glycosyltransferase [Taibaiella koreensis]|uniref:glycosyltransferase n=1 Tax=Taibaiella koreensis TaxID=1268548 RepID=UPI000E5A0E12|nr:glycosyltransferase [Taibaiella koreensis]
MTLIIISLSLFLAYALLMMVYARGWRRVRSVHDAVATGTLPRISIIIPARNEAAHIGSCLQSILAQPYPAGMLELLVIDDFSTDGTESIAESLLTGGKGRVLQLKQYLSETERLNAYKKKALEIAIHEARGEWIVTTDADCLAPQGWLKALGNAMQNEQLQFVVAPVSFVPADRRTMLYYFQSLDFMTMQGITAASAVLRLGNMCNGANLAFRKSAYIAVDGYRGIDHIASGDDMMLMYKIQQQFPQGIGYLKAPEAVMSTPAQPDWHSFLNQRIRWSSKADKYDDKKLTLILALVYFFNCSFIALAVAGFVHWRYWLWLLGLLLVKTVVELLFLAPVAAFYGKRKELLWFPLLQPLHILYIILAGFLGKFGSYQWKGRRVK